MRVSHSPHRLPAPQKMRRSRTRQALGIAAVLLAAIVPDACGGENLKSVTYRQLDAIRQEKRNQLAAYLSRIQKKAAAIRTDPAMRKYFLIKKEYSELQRKAPPPKDAQDVIESLKKKIRQHYLEHYLAFYDILFVSRNGYVFSTIRQQKDYHKNLFSGDLTDTPLARQLESHPDQEFIDYQYYAVSDEPSAFFIEPMKEGDELEGWFVLQCAINKINTIFSRAEHLGQTGEVFLVNQKHQMLTESRFCPEESILKQHLSRENIDAKFAEERGHKIVLDYRGCRALTSFEVCPVLNSKWLLIAKIDEDEVLTRHYRQQAPELRDRFLQALLQPVDPTPRRFSAPEDMKIVDIDEFRKGEKEETLITFGVNTCTAIAVFLPGRFAYLGHASTYDRMYGEGAMDLLGHMLKRIRQFEIYPYQLRSMQAVIVAPHANSVMNTVDRLVEEGFLLSQIRFAYRPDARSATVIVPVADGFPLVKWTPDNDEGDPPTQDTQTLDTAGDRFKSLIGYE